MSRPSTSTAWLTLHADHHVDDLQDDQGDDGGPDEGDSHAFDLGPDLTDIAFE